MSEIPYPKTLTEFNSQFSTEEACRQYLAQLRWPSGFKCPKCVSSNAWLTKRGVMHCTSCGHQTSITAGTLFHRSRSPLQLWFHAIWWITAQKNGASALGLQRILGLGSYETAWTWLHKLRRAMVIPGREQLNDEVEIDETFVGGPGNKGKGNYAGEKMIVIIAAEIRGNAIGRIRLRCIEDTSAESLITFVKDVVAPGATVVTDGLLAYRHGLIDAGYIHQPRVVSNSGKAAHTLLPRVHRIASLLKRWILGTHQGRADRAHLPYYLDEFTFRFNRRTSDHRGLLFYRLLQQAVALEPVPYNKITGGRGIHKLQDVGTT